jgi:poly-gamma-glutamate synthesis protein (capsule biosynthesis protein)
LSQLDRANTSAVGVIQLTNGKTQADLSIVVAGDLCPMGRLEDLFRANEPHKALQEVMPYLSDADISIVNLECPLTAHRIPVAKSGPNLRADPLCATGIKTAGFDIVALANNHVMDMGESGLADTLTVCERADLKTVGAGKNLFDATRPLLVKAKRLTVALLAIAEHEHPIATENSAGAWPLDPIDNLCQIRDAKQRADFVLVVLHGGNEYYSLPSPRMVKVCRFLVDAGANAVISHHTHVPSGIEIYHGAPIVYGTGNLLFDWAGPRPEEWYAGYLVRLAVTTETVTEVRLIPYWQCRGEPITRLMTEEEANLFLKEIDRLSKVIADEKALSHQWTTFCQSKRVEYLSAVMGLSRFERRLLRVGVWPAWRLTKGQLTALYNLLACESHRDALISNLANQLTLWERES